MPRVIAGRAKGVILKAPQGDGTRPTADRTKEALFSALGERTAGSQVLDLFAGSGQLAIEALSRGAEGAVLAEKDRRVCRLIKDNLNKTRLQEQAEVLCMDALAAARKLLSEGRSFDLVFCDPPYALAEKFWPPLTELLSRGLLSEQGLCILEASSRDFTGGDEAGLCLIKSRRYGAAVLSFYEREKNSSEQPEA